MAVILAAAAEGGDDGLGEIADLAQDEHLLPEGDGSLRAVLRLLDAFRSTLEEPPPQLVRGVALLGGDQHGDGFCRLREIVVAAKAAIEAKRLERLKARPVDPSKVERIRSAVEKALLKGPLEVPFFQGVEIECGASNDAAEPVALVFREIEKAQLVDPPMVPPISNLEETFVRGSRDSSGHRAWRAFTCRPRTHVGVAARPEKEEFWLAIAPLIEQVGSDPLLVVSRPAEGRALRRCLWGPSESRPYLQHARGVDVFEDELPVGVAWLFSARALRCVRYGELDEKGRCVDVSFEIGEELKGELSVRFRQQLDWADTPIFELRMSEPDQANASESLTRIPVASQALMMRTASC